MVLLVGKQQPLVVARAVRRDSLDLTRALCTGEDKRVAKDLSDKRRRPGATRGPAEADGRQSPHAALAWRGAGPRQIRRKLAAIEARDEFLIDECLGIDLIAIASTAGPNPGTSPAGLIILVPNVDRVLQGRLFRAAFDG